MTTFIHTSDWQLGMTRRFLRNGADERYAAARLDAVRAIGRLAREEDARFVVVAGDVFESNQVGRRVILQTLEALRDVPVPVYLLPANHDPLTEASVYHSPVFRDNRPPHVTVVTDTNPIPVSGTVELVGAPWSGKRMAVNPVMPLLETLTRTPDGIQRVVLAHGAMDGPEEFPDSPASIGYREVKEALADGRLHYLALGDRHSHTHVGGDERIVYSGSPEVTAFRDPDPGHVNLVRLGPDGLRSEKRTVGVWRFTEAEVDITLPGDAQEFIRETEDIPDKTRTVLRLHLTGLVDLNTAAILENRISQWQDLFASVDVDSSRLHTTVDGDESLTDRFGGFAGKTVESLRELALRSGPDGETARDALLLLLRLAPEQVETEEKI